MSKLTWKVLKSQSRIVIYNMVVCMKRETENRGRVTVFNEVLDKAQWEFSEYLNKVKL